MLPRCTSTQKPYSVGASSGAGAYPNVGYQGDTPAIACQNFARLDGTSLMRVDQHVCMRNDTPGVNFPIIQLCDPTRASALDLSLDDGILISGLILSVWVSAAVFRWLAAAVSSKGEE